MYTLACVVLTPLKSYQAVSIHRFAYRQLRWLLVIIIALQGAAHLATIGSIDMLRP